MGGELPAPKIPRPMGVELSPISPFTGDHIFLYLHAVDGGDGQNGVSLKVQLRLAVPLLNHRQLSFQDHGQKVSGAASRFKKSRFDPLGFLLHQIKHGVDLAVSGQHLAMIRDPLLRYDLRFHRLFSLFTAKVLPTGRDFLRSGSASYYLFCFLSSKISTHIKIHFGW
jgi:hypothetical protein